VTGTQLLAARQKNLPGAQLWKPLGHFDDLPMKHIKQNIAWFLFLIANSEISGMQHHPLKK
jgi:hypothetical protein